MKIRNKLMITAVMLLISAVMLSTVSYAWFTISTAPEVKGIDTKVAVNENLEIALANTATGTVPALPENNGLTGNYYTWGNMIDLGVATQLSGEAGTNAYDTFMGDITLRPATYVENKGFFAPVYGADGRLSTEVDGTNDLAITEETATNYGWGKLVGGTEKHVYGYYIDVWMRSNVGGQVKLATAGTYRAESESTDNNTNLQGLGSTTASKNENFENGMNVAFRVIAAQTTADAATATANTSTIAANTVVATNTEVDGAGINSTTSAYDSAKANTLAITASDQFKLDANIATLVRVYIYLEGEDMTNADASIDNTDIVGSINLQFAIEGVDKNMDVDLPTTPNT